MLLYKLKLEMLIENIFKVLVQYNLFIINLSSGFKKSEQKILLKFIFFKSKRIFLDKKKEFITEKVLINFFSKVGII